MKKFLFAISLSFVLLFLSSLSFATEALYEQHIAKGLSALDTKNYREATAEFQAALREKPDDAAAALYLGISLNNAGEADAEAALKKALALNPADPRTNLELGILYFKKSNLEEAGDYFENTIKLAPETQLSSSASEYISAIKKKGIVKRWLLNVSAGGQYDSNVILTPDNGPLPQGISRKSDWRAIIYLKGKYNFITGQRVEASAAYSLYQSLHMKLSDFNVTQNLLEVSGAYAFSPVLTMRGRYSFEYVHVGWDKYNYAHLVSPELVVSEGGGYSTIIEYRYRNNHFIDSDLFSGNSERTGSGNIFGIAQNIPLGSFVLLRAGYAYDMDSTKKDYWDYDGNKGTAEIRWNISKDMLLNLAGEYYKKDYKGASSISSEKRKDSASTINVSATKALSDRFSITAGQLYTKNKSNIGAYDYKRMITSLFVSARF
jgi:tetratricopeptide (TPR) repeat protein